MEATMSFLLVVSTILVFTGCSDNPLQEDQKNRSIEVNEGQQFKLTKGDSAHLVSENIDILFIEVAKDGRCPTDVNCFWAGDAALALRIGEQVDTLHTTTVFGPDSLEVGALWIKIVNLQPRLSSEQTIEDVNYEAQLILQ